MQGNILTEFLLCYFFYLPYIERKWKFVPQLLDKKLENGLSGQHKFLVSMLLYSNDMRQRYLFRITFTINITLFSLTKKT